MMMIVTKVAFKTLIQMLSIPMIYMYQYIQMLMTSIDLLTDADDPDY